MHIKTLIIATLAVAGAGAANAADLGRGSSDDGGYKDAIPESAMWTGVTLGVGVGGAFSALSDDEVAAIGVSKSGVVASGEAVVSWQFPKSPIVVGAYGDLTYSDVFKAVGGGVGGQLGYAVGNIQPYVLAGGEFVKGNSGVAFGAGVKFRATPKINLEVEWKHTNWDTFDFDNVGVKTTSDTAMIKASYKLN
jgi:opacity protein-like surface antigen